MVGFGFILLLFLCAGANKYKMASKGLLFTILFTVIFVLFDSSDEVNAAKKPKAKIIGKDVKDFTDVDVHHLLDQWNVSK